MQDLSKILSYLINEKGCTEMVAGQLAAKLTKHKDIEAEFLWWLDTRQYPTENSLAVGEYTASQISEMDPVLDGAGVYNFLVTLRDNPEHARQIIAEGFIVQ